MTKAGFETIKTLKDAGFCNEQIRKFKRVFGVRAKITRKNLIKAEKSGLDVYHWFKETFQDIYVRKAFIRKDQKLFYTRIIKQNAINDRFYRGEIKYSTKNKYLQKMYRQDNLVLVNTIADALNLP